MTVVDEFVWTSGDDDTLVTWSLKTKAKVSELRPCSGFASLVFLRPNFWCSTVSSEVVLIDPKVYLSSFFPSQPQTLL
jgi:hypothetical protein